MRPTEHLIPDAIDEGRRLEETFSPERTPWFTVQEAMDDAFARFADQEAIVGSDRRLTFAEVGAMARALGSALRERFEPGFRAAVWAPNDWQWAVVAAGIWYAGGVLVPIGTRLRALDAGDILQRTGASVLFVPDEFLGASFPGMLGDEFGVGTDRPFDELSALELLVLTTGTPGSWTGATTLDELVSHETQLPLHRSEPDDPLEIIFTSGTTGQAKGVVVGHRQTLQCYWTSVGLNGLRRGDRYLTVMPFGHAGGLNACLLASMLHGFTNVAMQTFDVDAAVEILGSEHISVMMGAPTIIRDIVTHPRFATQDTSALRIALVGSANVEPELIEQLMDDAGFHRVVNLYGMSESPNVCLTRADADRQTVSTTVGHPLPGVELRVVDDEGSLVPDGEPGEIAVRGYQLMQGYLDDPALTERSYDAEGWFRTGDVGAIDPVSRAVRLIDRKKDVVNVGGFNVYPGEVEAYLRRHPTVATAAVVAMPDPRLGEVCCAFVTPAPGATVKQEDILGSLRGKIANYKVPRAVVAVEAFPVNATGKIDKLRLRQQAQDLFGQGGGGAS